MIVLGEGRYLRVPKMERRKMTVCIAAVCDNGSDDPKIILCTDNLVSSALGSAETMLKTRMLGKNWNCLTAGDESDLLGFSASLAKKFRHVTIREKKTIDETNAGELVRQVLMEMKKQKADDIVRADYAISYEELLANGKARFPEEIFRDAMLTVRAAHVDAQCIVAGFADGFPLLLQTERNGRVAVHEEFAAVGEGAYLAQSILLHRAHSDVLPFACALYSVYEAKKYAEGARSVGSNTSIVVHHKDGRREIVNVGGFSALDKHYKLYGPKPISDDLKISTSMFTALAPLRDA